MSVFHALRIVAIFCRYRLDRLAWVYLPAWMRLLLLPARLIPAPASPEASLRLALERLGPIFVKFGQLLSTRRDLLTPELATELEKLQDQVAPFSGALATRIIEASLSGPVDEVFSYLASEPLASASVAQVHAATLRNGDDVVVKVIRPGIDAVIERDLALMRVIASLIERFWSEGQRLHPVAIVSDYDQTISGELNLQLEAANTARLRDNWQHTGKLYVPAVYFEHSSRSVMVIERIYGVMANDIETLKSNGVNLKKLAHLGVEIFFTQVFTDNYFHADMHPGNVFIDITDPENPTYIALDCAIIGSLTESDKNYLAKNLLAFFNQDYREVAVLHVQSGWVPADTNVDEFEAIIRTVCEPIFRKPMKDISFGHLLVSLFNTARQFNMEVQPQLVLLQKTLLNIEGMGRQIYDDLDLWETAAPFMEALMAERYGIRRLLGALVENAPRFVEKLPELPALALRAMEDLNDLGSHMTAQNQLMATLKTELVDQQRRARRQRLGGLAMLGALLGVLLPQVGIAASDNMLLGSSILGSLGFYWLFLHG